MRSLEIKTAKCSPLNLNKQSILPENIVAIFALVQNPLKLDYIEPLKMRKLS